MLCIRSSHVSIRIFVQLLPPSGVRSDPPREPTLCYPPPGARTRHTADLHSLHKKRCMRETIATDSHDATYCSTTSLNGMSWGAKSGRTRLTKMGTPRCWSERAPVPRWCLMPCITRRKLNAMMGTRSTGGQGVQEEGNRCIGKGSQEPGSHACNHGPYALNARAHVRSSSRHPFHVSCFRKHVHTHTSITFPMRGTPNERCIPNLGYMERACFWNHGFPRYTCWDTIRRKRV